MLKCSTSFFPKSLNQSRNAGENAKKELDEYKLPGETALSDDQSGTISQMALVKARDRAMSFQDRMDPLLCESSLHGCLDPVSYPNFMHLHPH